MAYTEFTNELATAVDQLCSSVYQQMFEIVAKEQPNRLSNEQHIVLLLNPRVITWYQGDRRQEIVERIRHTHLKWFNNWLTEQNTGLPPYIKWSPVMSELMLNICNILFRLDLGDVISTDETRNAFRQIADTIKGILLSVSKSNPVIIDELVVPLIQELLLILFYFTLDSDVAIYLKSLQIATVFITFIENTINGGSAYEARLRNSLRSLKVLTQHDQIREELIKQGGQSLFLRLVLEDQFDPLRAKLPALEIFLALAFNKDFATTLKDNEKFMNHVRTLTSSSQQDLQRVATALVWKLEKEPDAAAKHIEDQRSSSSVPVLDKKQFDIMISYSHSDKDLCHRILNVLEKDQLRVWIDSRLMHGATFDAMAKAIENAEFVLVCMSDAYKQSPFCEMEASYAVKRRCRIIPLVMTSNYKADGWLGVLTSALIYIDFPKLGFNKGYEELKKQIQLIRMNDSNSTAVKQDPLHHDPHSLTNRTPKIFPSVIKNKEPRPVVDYPHCIDTWTEEHVKSFLLDKELDALLPVLEGMNGQLLHQVYSMCQANQQGMFLSIKEDIAKSERGTLSLKDYLTFLKDIKSYIPYSASNQLNPTSAVCNLM